MADKNPAKIAKKQRVYKKKLGPVIAERERHKYHTDMQFQLKSTAQLSETEALKKDSETFKMVGCSKHLCAHHRSSFHVARAVSAYEVDHIFPLNLYTENEMLKMTNYHNLQPLAKAVNNSKHSKLPSKSDALKVPKELLAVGC